MMIWTSSAVEVLRDATAKAEKMNHREVHPLHLMWALTGKSGFAALRNGRSDHRQARIHFQVEKDLSLLQVVDHQNNEDSGEYASPGLRLQNLLLRAADFSARNRPELAKGRVGEQELLKALLPDDHRAAGLLRASMELEQIPA